MAAPIEATRGLPIEKQGKRGKPIEKQGARGFPNYKADLQHGCPIQGTADDLGVAIANTQRGVQFTKVYGEGV